MNGVFWFGIRNMSGATEHHPIRHSNGSSQQCNHLESTPAAENVASVVGLESGRSKEASEPTLEGEEP